MDSLLQTLKQRAVTRQSMSVGNLIVDHKYRINKFTNKETRFGPATICSLIEGDTGIDVFLPKSVRLSDEEAHEYNERPVRELSLIFRGIRGKAFIINFE